MRVVAPLGGHLISIIRVVVPLEDHLTSSMRVVAPLEDYLTSSMWVGTEVIHLIRKSIVGEAQLVGLSS